MNHKKEVLLHHENAMKNNGFCRRPTFFVNPLIYYGITFCRILENQDGGTHPYEHS